MPSIIPISNTLPFDINANNTFVNSVANNDCITITSANSDGSVLIADYNKVDFLQSINILINNTTNQIAGLQNQLTKLNNIITTINNLV